MEAVLFQLRPLYSYGYTSLREHINLTVAVISHLITKEMLAFLVFIFCRQCGAAFVFVLNITLKDSFGIILYFQ